MIKYIVLFAGLFLLSRSIQEGFLYIILSLISGLFLITYGIMCAEDGK
jgi:hypothetical protein